jgi:hypothetical protein
MTPPKPISDILAKAMNSPNRPGDFGGAAAAADSEDIGLN